MAFIVPPMSPDLIAALKRAVPNGMPPGGPGAAPPITGGMPLAGRAMPAAPAVALPPTATLAPAPAATPVQPKAPPPVTDDPTAGMGTVPETPNLSKYLDPALANIQNLMQQRQQADQRTRIDPNAVRPRIWERIVGGLLGATQLRNPENAGAVAGQVVNRRLNQAERTRSLALDPIDQELAAQEKELPLYTAAGEAAYRQAELGLNTARENRERFTAAKNADYKADIADVRQQIAQNNLEMAQKKLDETAERNANQNKNAQDRIAIQQQLEEVRQQLADARDREVDNKEKKAKSSTAAVGVEQRKATALQKAHNDYVKATKDLPLNDPNHRWTDDEKAELQTAKDAFDDAQQEAEDAYEAEIQASGGSAPHQDVRESWRSKPAQPAAAAPVKQTGNTAGEVPQEVGPASEKPLQTAKDAQGRRIGYYQSTKQWMQLPGGK